MRNFITAPALTSRHFWLVVLPLALLVVGALAPSAVAQGDDSSQLTVVVQALNVREGPGVSYPAFDILQQGDQVTVIGFDSARDWWQVQLPDGQAGWVSGGAAYVSVSGDTASLQETTGSESIGEALHNSEFTIQNSQFTGTLVFQTASGGPIYAINADGANLHYLTSGIDPALSPDGQWVAFTRWDDTQNGALGSLWAINVDGSGERAILGEIHQPKSPAWSPDGTQIVISMQHGGRVQEERKCTGQRPPPDAYDVDGNRKDSGDIEFCYTLPPHPFWDLRVVDVASGGFEDLPTDLFSYTPTWDPANAWHVVYHGDRGLMNLDLTPGVRTTSALTDDVSDHSPAFSPDGTKIAVNYKQHDHWDIQVLKADGSGRARLTETPLYVTVQQEINGEEPRAWNNVAPTWSPDGSQIAFLTDRTGQWEIWVMNADGSDQRPLFASGTLAGISLQYHSVDERILSWR